MAPRTAECRVSVKGAVRAEAERMNIAWQRAVGRDMLGGYSRKELLQKLRCRGNGTEIDGQV